MSFTPPFSNTNYRFPPFSSNNNVGNNNNVPQTSNEILQRSIRNNFLNCQYLNSPTVNRCHLSTPNPLTTTTSSVSNIAQLPRPPIAPHLSHPNNHPPNFVNYVSQPSDVSPSFHLFLDQSCNRTTVPPVVPNSNNANFNFEPRNIPIHHFPPPVSNVACNTLPANIHYQKFQNNLCINNPGTKPMTLSSLPQFPVSANQNATNVFNSQVSYSTGNVGNSTSQHLIYTTPVTVKSSMTYSSQDSVANSQNNCIVQVPQQFPLNDASKSQILNIPSNSLKLDKEAKVAVFLAKFSSKKKENEHQVTIPEFRYVIKAAVRMITMLKERKSKLSNLLGASESEWKSEVKNAQNEQEELSTLCSFISAPDHLNSIVEKLRLIKKRRERKRKTKQNKLSEKMRADQKRKERDQEIDKWLDDIKEKNQKIKREAELKKEADYILLEVRRKIYEAKKTIEKIKVFEKLRNARQANATQKGLHVLSMHNLKFEKKMSVLKETMMKQLADYEAEEKALKVMLETEQEGQREEEIQWKIKKFKALQQKKQNHIIQCLFGISDDPLPTDPLYLFHKYHTSANSSIESLIQIRQQWDIHIDEDGDVIPQHWVVPVAPSNSSWEQCLVTSNN